MSIEKSELLQSRFADTHNVEPSVGTPTMTSLCKVTTEETAARSWRITLGRVERRDRNAIMNSVVPDLPLFKVADFAYLAASRIPPPLVPPRRSNPIWSLLAPDGSHIISPIFVQIEWGMSSGSRNRILANWPMCGGSVVIRGSQIEVFGGVLVEQNGPPAIDLGAFPVLNASVIPEEGPTVADNDLSLTQSVLVQDIDLGPAGVAGLQTNGVGNPAAGFAVGGVSPPQAAIPRSAIFGIGPFSGWQAVIVPRGGAFGGGGATSRTLVIELADGSVTLRPQQFELRDHEIPDGLGGFISSPGNVGIIYSVGPGAPGPQTVAALEALIDTSALIRVETPSPGQADEITDQWTNIGAFTPVAPGIGLGEIVGATQGGHMYVPDFARRVNVSVTTPTSGFIGEDPRIPADGPLTTQLVWYDDQGIVVFSEIQGAILEQATGAPILEPQVWRPVPAQAVMLGIYATRSGTPAGEAMLAYAHWRIAP
jgi:hypothetical protein